MPANFPTRVTTALAALNAVTNSAVTFADRVVAVLNTVFGANNPFGTAATRDTGTAEGNVPVLDTTGKIASSALPPATATRAGAVQIASALAGAAAGSVPTAAQVTAESARLIALTAGINTDNIQMVDMTSATPFVAARGGFIIASGGAGSGAGDTTIRFSVDGSPVTVTVRKSTEILMNVPNLFSVGGGRGPIVFDLTMIGKGVNGPTSILDAELYIGLVETGGGTFNVSVGRAGRNGSTGFAYFMQLN